jgi:hypothetical protein
VIRLEHRSLPAGLSAVARRGDRGELTIVVSESLDAGRQRAAVRAALRAARRRDWRLGLLPVPALVLVSAARTALVRLGHLMRAHVVATAFTAAATAGVVAASVLVLGMPASHLPPGASGRPGYTQSPGASQPAPGQAHSRTRPGASAPSHAGGSGPGVVAAVGPNGSPRPTASSQPAPSPQPSTSTSSPGGSTPGPSPTPSTSPPQPTPTPSSSGGSGGGRTCIKILGIVICL